MRKLLFGGLLAMTILGLGLAKPSLADTATTVKGTLTAISGVTAPAILTINVTGVDYTVNVDTNTKLIRKYGGLSALDEFGIGDTLWATGTLSGTTMAATTVKNISIQRIGGELWGKIVSLDATAQTFVFDPTRKDVVNQTVTVNSKTIVFQGNRQGEFGDLTAGMTVKVIGLRNTTAKTMVADRILIKLTELNGTIKTIDCSATVPTMTVSVKGGKTAKTWTVNVTSSTIIHDKYIHQMPCSDLAVDHRVQIRGLKTGPTTVNALQIRDMNTRKTMSKWSGTITKLDAVAMTFTIDQKKGDDVPVAITTATTLVGEDGKIITIDKLANDHKVMVWGSLSSGTVTANLVMDQSVNK